MHLPPGFVHTPDPGPGPGSQGHDLKEEPLDIPPPTPVRPPVAAKPPNHLILAILATVLCCPPLGIPAIIFAAQVDGKAASGDTAGAAEASRKAKLFSMLSIGLGCLGTLLYVIFMAVVFQDG